MCMSPKCVPGACEARRGHFHLILTLFFFFDFFNGLVVIQVYVVHSPSVCMFLRFLLLLISAIHIRFSNFFYLITLPSSIWLVVFSHDSKC